MIPGLVLVLVLIALFSDSGWVMLLAVLAAAFFAYPEIIGKVLHIFMVNFKGNC